jgi:hypothetical protein
VLQGFSAEFSHSDRDVKGDTAKVMAAPKVSQSRKFNILVVLHSLNPLVNDI